MTEADRTFDWTLLPGGAPTPPRDPDERSGEIAGRYQLRRLLGKGGYGQVLEAQDPLTDELVAIKFLEAATGERLEGVLREVTALRFLRLPGVVRLRDDGFDGDRYFMVMDRVVGEPFAGPPRARSWSEIEGTALELLEILGRVHLAGVVHRDLKPANVLVTAAGRPVVLDFGIAGGQPLSLTSEGGPGGGTPLYLAPEQIHGKVCDGRTDLYAVGVMLFAALAGSWPHNGRTHVEIMRDRIRRPAQPMAELAPDAPDEVAAVIDALLQRDPERRPASALAALERLGGRSRGRVVDLLPPHLPHLPVPDAEALRPLFRGPDTFHHLREDAASALWARTGGQPAAVADELAAWVRAGLSWREDALLVIERPSLAQLEAGLVVGLTPPDDAPTLSGDALAMRDWIRIAWPDATPALLAALSGRSSTEILTALAELREARLCWDLPGGRLGTRPGVPPQGEADEARLRAAHGRLADALPRPSEARLRHLLRAGATADVLLPELSALARSLLVEGQLPRALAVLEIGLPLARRPGDWADDEEELLRLVSLTALAHEDDAALDRALYDLGRATGGSDLRESLMLLLQGVRAALRGEGARGLGLLDALAPFDDEELEIWRQAGRARAASRVGLTREGELLDELETWAARGSPLRAAKLAGWRANWLYRQGRFAEAATLHRASGAAKRAAGDGVATLVNAATCAMYALQFLEADRLAQRARDEAARLRHPRFEALATWLIRTLAYRNRVALRPDEALVDAAALLGSHIEAIFAMNEAAVAWRQGDTPTAARLARRAATAYRARGYREPGLLSEALALAAERTVTPTQVAPLVEAALQFRVPALAVQTLGLLYLSVDASDPNIREHAIRLATCRPVTEWGACLDVMSFDEALGRVRVTN